jgi:hypothetical protein
MIEVTFEVKVQVTPDKGKDTPTLDQAADAATAVLEAAINDLCEHYGGLVVELDNIDVYDTVDTDDEDEED